MTKKTLQDIQKSLEFSYGEILRATVDAQMKAKFAGDFDRLDELIEKENEARTKTHDARRRALAAELTDDHLARLTEGLKDKAERAKEVLKDLRRTKDTLDAIGKAAQLAAAILSTVAMIV